ncbi:DeoR/GlpR family DNA-binding transcription regulator [Gellertiella hungarica]|uniref:DeoR/GlpR family transcriptional regulator of sugar metabolism n=1 Tax=Gellertiella hungarica TaxID=1572859 RepID=A0A7W6J7L1_9HYPH|nr:DeoR/GlpR family DNA-binding transcription regulator [Gellertiella hungarica]MBB4066296.1 DeoR/GlpR family transcriptional regulator of sugar metabolism [Gellertiella hungarica]
MKREDRRQAIMDLLVEQRMVELDALSERFGVSRMTIHRDLDDLEEAGMLRKVRGGATIESSTQFESDFRFRERQEGEAKRRMAEAALELIEPGMTVAVNDGSMAAVLGSILPRKRPLTVITNNAAIIETLRMEPGITTIALGGVYSAKFNAYFGVVTEESMARLRADIAFISAPAVSGGMAFHMDDGVIRAKRAMIASASRACLLVNHQRFGKSALHVLARISDFERVITDDLPPREALEAFEKNGAMLDVAKDKEPVA